jgi:hypothetical protein
MTDGVKTLFSFRNTWIDFAAAFPREFIISGIQDYSYVRIYTVSEREINSVIIMSIKMKRTNMCTK